MQTPHGDMADPQLRLRRVRLVDDVHARFLIARDVERLTDIGRAPCPVAKILCRMPHGIIDRHITNHHQRGRIRTIVLVVKRLHAFAGDPFDTLLVATGKTRKP